VCSTEQLSYSAVPGTVSVVDTVGTVGSYSSIAIGLDGFPVISYYDQSNTNLKIVHCTDRPCTTHDAPVTLDASASVGWDTSLAIGSDGFPVVSYYDATNTALKAVHCSNVACSAHDTPSTLDNSGNVGFGSSLAIGTDNLPIVSYVGGTSNDLVVVRCATKTCATADTPIAQSIGDFVNGDTALAIGADGFPVITYWNAAGPTKVVHCTDSTCSTRDPVATVDSANASLQGPAIAIGVDGFPILSYWDSANIDLKSVHCTSRACNTHDTPVVVESIGDVGSGSSIAIGVDGLPVIAYHDSAIGKMLVLHCSNLACTTHDNPFVADNGGSGLHTAMAIGVDNRPVVSLDGGASDLHVAQIEMIVSGIVYK